MSRHERHHNRQFYNDGVDDLPIPTGDRYWAVDKVRDFRYLQGLIGKTFWELFGRTPGVIYSGTITAPSYTTLNIGQSSGIVEFDVEVGNDGIAWAIPQTKETKQIYVLVENPIVSGFSLSGATLDGSTPNYLKLSYAELNGLTRSRHFASGTYVYVVSDSYLLTCTSAAPTNKEVVLATIVGDGASTITITPPANAASILSSYPEIIATVNQVMLPKRKYLVKEGCNELTLPANPVAGDSVEIDADSVARIMQNDANHGIEFRKQFFTTKGVAVPPPASAPSGFVQLFPGDSVRAVYKGAGLSRIEPGVKLADPAALPTGNARGSSFSYDGVYLAVAHSTSPYITIYKRSGDTFTKLADPAALPAGTGNGCAFSYDGTYLAVAHATTPYITIYKRTAGTDTFVKLADPAALPAGTGNGCAFSYDGTYLAVAHTTSPYITIYKRTAGTDTFVKLADPAALPAADGLSCSFSYGGNYLAVACPTSPYITIYKKSGDTFTKLADPSSLPAGSGYGCAFSYDSTYLAVAHNTSPYITIYKRSGDTFTKLSDPSSLPAGRGYGCSFSYDGTYLVITNLNSPYITIYKRSGDTFTKLADPAALPTGNGRYCSFSYDGVYFAVAHETTPYVAIYKLMESITKQWMVTKFETKYLPDHSDGDNGDYPYRFR